jgi:mannose-6-phosphate isomerase-like protein (cupin superfamily)
VLAGELTVRLGVEGEQVAAPAGTLVRVPPLVVHGFGNTSDAEVRYLNLHAPGQGFADFLRALRDGRDLSYDQEPPPADGGRPAAEAMVGGHLSVSECPGQRTVVLADVDAIAVAETRVDPGGTPVSPHAHEGHAEWLFALEGEMVLTAGPQELRVEAGSWAEVPQGVSHSLSFPGETRFLELHSPVS